MMLRTSQLSQVGMLIQEEICIFFPYFLSVSLKEGCNEFLIPRETGDKFLLYEKGNYHSILDSSPSANSTA